MDALEQTGQADNTLVIYTSDHGDHNGDRRMWTKMSLYDESARIPMLIQGPDIPGAKTIDTLASLVDIYPTVLQAVDAEDDEIDRPGLSLRSLVDGASADRGVLSEYHDGGSPVGMFMWRKGQWKYNCYPGYAPELFDLAADPDELCDLSQDPAYSQDLKRCQDDMGALLDPIAANDLAFADQAERISQLGGVEAILASEEFDHTPTPSG
jgi:choline-sulfatase